MPYEPISAPLTGRQSPTAYDMVKDAGPHRGITTQATENGRVVQCYNKAKKVAGWRVAGFHVLNFITAGFAGAVGSLCAKSQAMGSQKSVNSTRHFGELYNAATYKTKRNSGWNKTLKTLATIWSFPAHVLLSPARLLQNSLGPDMFRFRAQRSKEFGKSSWGMFSSVHGINSTTAMKRKEVYRSMYDELTVAAQRDKISKQQALQSVSSGQQPAADYVNSPVRVACSSGSPSLKKAMLLHGKKEFSEQHVLFLNWSSKVLDKADPNSPNYQANYRISKREMLDAYQNFIKTDSDREINIDSPQRRWAEQHLDPDNHNSMLADYKVRSQQARHLLTVARVPAGQIPATALEDPLTVDPERVMRNIENETFDDNQNTQIVKQLKAIDSSIYDVQADSLARMRNDLQRNAGVADDD